MSDLQFNDKSELELEKPLRQRIASIWKQAWPYVAKVLWVIGIFVWTVGIAFIAYTEIPTFTDNAIHTGSQISFQYDGIRAISFTSDSPVTLQIGEHRHAFLFVNTDDGSVAQSTVVSTSSLNAQGRLRHVFGPTVVSQGHWRRVDGDDFDNNPDFYLTSGSVITLTIYPTGSALWVWIKGIVVALLVWFFLGFFMVMSGEWVIKQSLKLLGRYSHGPGS